MPCKTPNSGEEACCGIGKSKTKHACIVEADESTRMRLEGVPCRFHEDLIAAKGKTLSHYNLVHKFISMPQALKKKKTGCEGGRGKSNAKLEKIPAWRLTKVRNKKRGDQ